MKFQNATRGGNSLKQNPRISNRAASNIEFCVFPRLDSPRGVSDKTQTMSGLSGAPSGTASQTI